MPLSAGTRLGPYEVLAPIGRIRNLQHYHMGRLRPRRIPALRGNCPFSVSWGRSTATNSSAPLRNTAQLPASPYCCIWYGPDGTCSTGGAILKGIQVDNGYGEANNRTLMSTNHFLRLCRSEERRVGK